MCFFGTNFCNVECVSDFFSFYILALNLSFQFNVLVTIFKHAISVVYQFCVCY
jgi:hypothetical protein